MYTVQKVLNYYYYKPSKKYSSCDTIPLKPPFLKLLKHHRYPSTLPAPIVILNSTAYVTQWGVGINVSKSDAK
jgi:hypothetical protein